MKTLRLHRHAHPQPPPERDPAACLRSLGAALLLLALASYTPSDPSFNTVGGYCRRGPASPQLDRPPRRLSRRRPAANPRRRGLSLPVLLARLGVCWLRSRAAGSPWPKCSAWCSGCSSRPPPSPCCPASALAHALPIVRPHRRARRRRDGALPQPARHMLVVGLMVCSRSISPPPSPSTPRASGPPITSPSSAALREKWNRLAHAVATPSPAEMIDQEGEVSAPGARRPTPKLAAARKSGRAAAKATRRRRNTLLSGIFGWLPATASRQRRAVPSSRARSSRPRAPVWQAMPRTNVDAPPVTAVLAPPPPPPLPSPRPSPPLPRRCRRSPMSSDSPSFAHRPSQLHRRR